MNTVTDASTHIRTMDITIPIMRFHLNLLENMKSVSRSSAITATASMTVRSDGSKSVSMSITKNAAVTRASSSNATIYPFFRGKALLF